MSRKEPSINDVIRVGRVSAVYPERHTVKVDFPDRGDGLVTKELSVTSSLTRKNHFYALPDEGEHVICAFYGNGLSEGAVLGSIYDKGNTPPIPDRDIYSVVFEDGTQVTVDRKNHVVEIRDSYESVLHFEDGNILLKAPNTVSIEQGGKGQRISVDKEGNIAIKGAEGGNISIMVNGQMVIDARDRLVLRSQHIHTDKNSGSEGGY